eukprot:TRINITY_DN6127_c0_g2_i11.p1 TRINITY_DN6127_c0_g2~~TRINITY_DN6127_c0_g2_i11.p1  ORF type:complete len:421 (-),score=40.98 TRINITY_DN6127_c0_g2_i11:317-1579(-)
MYNMVYVEDDAYTGRGQLCDSGAWTGLPSAEARLQITKHLEEQGLGGALSNYRLRDWLVSRQRYWGAPIPVIHCQQCGAVPVPEQDLPVRLPENVKFTGRGASPLLTAQDWVNVKCPCCGGAARRDTDTLDTFVDSSWYFLRYPSASLPNRIFDTQLINKLMPVPVYIGGIEHAILHLLYSRFITRFLHTEGWLNSPEPFKALLTQGMVLGRTYKLPQSGSYVRPDQVTVSGTSAVETATGKKLNVVWEKMSKSKFNGVAPEDAFEKYGADVTRLFILFKAPPEKALEWESQQIAGQSRWVVRVWNLVQDFIQARAQQPGVAEDQPEETLSQLERRLRSTQQQTIEKVTGHFSSDRAFNVAIAELHKLTNTLGDFPSKTSPVFYQVILLSITIIDFPSHLHHISFTLYITLPSHSNQPTL